MPGSKLGRHVRARSISAYGPRKRLDERAGRGSVSFYSRPMRTRSSSLNICLRRRKSLLIAGRVTPSQSPASVTLRVCSSACSDSSTFKSEATQPADPPGERVALSSSSDLAPRRRVLPHLVVFPPRVQGHSLRWSSQASLRATRVQGSVRRARLLPLGSCERLIVRRPFRAGPRFWAGWPRRAASWSSERTGHRLQLDFPP